SRRLPFRRLDAAGRGRSPFHAMNKRRTPSRRQRGVALIEVLVAILIFSIGVLGLIGLQSRAIAVSMDTEDRNRASLLANELVSMLWLRGTSDITADEKTAWEDRVADATQGG